ncbi:unnamed protein product [Rotaria sp. Silwood2]|nr:unnamed protein product [Rotaria sp. Silwood2]
MVCVRFFSGKLNFIFIINFFYSLGPEQKNVIIQRDRYGYGLTVSGDNPVFVLSVREGGAAHRAGININDQIIKVNGTRVTHCTHVDVVNLIKSKLDFIV